MRITSKDLDTVAVSICRMLGMPTMPYTETKPGYLVGNIGCYFIEASGGSYRMVQMHNEAGGTRSILWARTKSELYAKMNSFCVGLDAGRGAQA